MLGSILIKNARIIDPSGELDRKGDIFLENGKIVSSGIECDNEADTVIDATGLVASPGLVDMHVHTREPGYTYKDDICSVSEAAAAGGVTTIVTMPNTDPVIDSKETIEFINEKASKALINVKIAASMTQNKENGKLTDFGKLKNAGAIAFSNDGVCLPDSNVLYEALKSASWYDVPILDHCEDASLSDGGIINDGIVSAALGVKGIKTTAESAGTARDLAIANSVDARIHICHVSTSSAIKYIGFAKKNGTKVTAETCPQYFMLNDELLLSQDADLRCNPPIRSEMDRRAVIRGIIDGTIDVIATDHAPHSAEEKSDFTSAPNGVLGLETSLAAGITGLVKHDYITLFKLIYMMSTVPAQILGINAGTLKAGAPADIVLFDLNEKWTVDAEKLHGRAKNTPFKGMELSGKVKYTICRGEIVYCDK
ncbi:MAG: dihydroorotase [Clostridiales bacterium]|nr:dihydroorotase [Clostridiales bacterium]